MSSKISEYKKQSGDIERGERKGTAVGNITKNLHASPKSIEENKSRIEGRLKGKQKQNKLLKIIKENTIVPPHTVSQHTVEENSKVELQSLHGKKKKKTPKVF